jgi:hypothetical protein
MSKKYTIQEVCTIVAQRGYKLISQEYKNAHEKLQIECPEHGVFEMKFYCFKNSKQNCPNCSHRSFRYTIEEVQKIIKNKGLKLLSKEYLKNTQKLQIECPEHGVFERTLDSLKQSKQGCLKCSILNRSNKRKNNYQIIKKNIEDKGFVLITKENDYKNNKTKLQIECSQHGIFKMRYNDFQQGCKCPICATKISKSHEEIIYYIQQNYKNEIIVNDRSVLEGKEIDIYLPKAKLGIEFDGLYWHSEKLKPKAKEENKKKIQSVQQKNINILMIYEDEWKDLKKQELIKSMIRHRLGIYNKKFRASKLQIRKLDKNNQFKDFFESYHLDGHVNASFAYGLFLGNELISCMSFRKSFTDKCWEIARFATNYNYLVYGNASKIIKQFKQDVGEKLITYSNNRLSHGNVYKKLGFKEITKTTDPSYYYTDFKTRLWRFKCKRINDPLILSKYPTEKDQAEGGVFSQKYLGHNKPLYKIYDYGHRKWEL